MNVKFNGATLKQTIQFQGFIVIFHLFMLWEKLVHWDCIDCKYMYTSYVCQHIQFEEFILIILPVHILRETNYLRIYVLQVHVYKLCFSKYSVWRVHSDISPVHTFQETNYLRLYILQVQVYKLCSQNIPFEEFIVIFHQFIFWEKYSLRLYILQVHIHKLSKY